MSDADEILTRSQKVELAERALAESKSSLAELIAQQVIKKQEVATMKAEYTQKKENPTEGDPKVMKTILKQMRATIKTGAGEIKIFAAQVKETKQRIKDLNEVLRNVKREMRAEEAARKEATKALKKVVKATA